MTVSRNAIKMLQRQLAVLLEPRFEVEPVCAQERARYERQERHFRNRAKYLREILAALGHPAAPATGAPGRAGR